MIFRCKNCGGNVVYSPERKKMFCPFCESEDSEEREDGVIEKVYPKAKPDTNAAEILEYLESVK